MSFDARERSVHAGAPVELYDFMRGSTVYRYTSADVAITVGADTYAPQALRRGKIEASTERARNELQIECDRSFPIAELFRVTSPTDVIGVVVRRLHRGDGEVTVIWSGRVLNCSREGLSVTLNCEPVSSSLKRPGLRRLYQRPCPHVLYGQGLGQCNVNRALHSTVTSVTALAGVVLTVAALGTKPWAGGFVEWEVEPGSLERRFIESFAGLSLTLSQAFQGLSVGDPVTVSPGCNHTTVVCSDVYGNIANHGGFPAMPRKNPFDGTPVY